MENADLPDLRRKLCLIFEDGLMNVCLQFGAVSEPSCNDSTSHSRGRSRCLSAHVISSRLPSFNINFDVLNAPLTARSAELLPSQKYG
jgi:hypothetical protein